MATYADEKLTLSTGKVVPITNGIIGLSPNDTAIFTGLDDWIWRGLDAPVDASLTAAEVAEIADYMIALWTALKKTVSDA